MSLFPRKLYDELAVCSQAAIMTCAMNLLRLISALVMLATASSTFAQDASASQTQAANFEVVFYRIYSDLVTHKDIVNAASAALVAEGYKLKSYSDWMKTLAARARKNLQLSLRGSGESAIDADSFADRVNASRKGAERLYPEVAVTNSPIYLRVGAERRILSSIYPDYFKNPNWPMMLTNECIALMVFESQEKQAQNAQASMSLEQAQKALEYDKQTLDFLKQIKEFGQQRR